MFWLDCPAQPLRTQGTADRVVIRRRYVLGCLAIGLIPMCFSSGCVQRRMTIRSNPPGARVYVDDYDVGITPVSTSFIYYGRRKIQLVKDGYETLTITQPVWPPWYEIPPLDFVSDNLVPGEIRDERCLPVYQLRPQVVVPTDQLLGRAEQLRRGVQASATGRPATAAPDVRINSPPRGPEAIPDPGSMQPIVTPPPAGSQPNYPLPPGR
jgi:hypothetical protein